MSARGVSGQPRAWRWLAALLFGASACSSDSTLPEPELDRERLLDPETCRSCHPGQYEEWRGSAHAQAADDPVFLAMNRRGQEETGGRLGDFCVRCHAPLAVLEGESEDGLNLGELPAALRGVTCYFCHSVERVVGDHNNALELATDGALRGPFADPQRNSAHRSRYSPHLDVSELDSAALCGACHDVTLEPEFAAAELALERTYAEWQSTLFARPTAEGGLSCGGCHLPSSPTRRRSAEVPDAPARLSRRHDMEGVDLPFPGAFGQARQRLLVERFLASSLLAEICVSDVGAVQLVLENVGAGHHFPSGASHDREIWLELSAFAAGDDEPLFSTVAPEDATPDAPSVQLKDHALTAQGEPAHMFWDIAGFAESTTIPGVATRDPLDPEFHRERRVFLFDTRQVEIANIDRVTLKVRVRPIALGVLHDLVESGHLDAAVAEAMPVVDLLPDRCYDEETLAAFPDILRAPGADCSGETDRDFTLVWQRADAVAGNPRFRATRIDFEPALCLSHPTFVAVPATP